MKKVFALMSMFAMLTFANFNGVMAQDAPAPEATEQVAADENATEAVAAEEAPAEEAAAAATDDT